MHIRAPKGTKDILPEESYKWQYIEHKIREVCNLYAYNEIRTPVFEHTELFERGVGDTTDIVQKEMYTFTDKGGRSITLRPEGTAPVVRSYIQNSLHSTLQPTKSYYICSCYRHERPQAGRLREFHQFGVEVFGSDAPSIDAEIISIAMTLLNKLGVKGTQLNINSIGCPVCRKTYYKELKKYFVSQLDKLCITCKDRLEKNPLRILDCKNQSCNVLAMDAPHLLEFLCDECSQHFDNLKRYLNNMKIEYRINPLIVRGLDYYTKTVFEIISEGIGAQNTVCGGGRYDLLVEDLGGKPTPAIGFGLGLERLLLTMEEQNIKIPKPNSLSLFIANIGESAGFKAHLLVEDFRKKGISADNDHMGRSLRAQLKYADKIGAIYTIVLGEDEINTNKAILKNMKNGDEKEIDLTKLTLLDL